MGVTPATDSAQVKLAYSIAASCAMVAGFRLRLKPWPGATLHVSGVGIVPVLPGALDYFTRRPRPAFRAVPTLT